MTAGPPSSVTDSTFASAKVRSLNPHVIRLLVSEPALPWRNDVIDRLEELVRLRDGWDGYNAEPVSLANAYFALRILESICPSDVAVPQIVPGSGGDVQIEWHTNDTDIELHVKAPNDVVAWRKSPTTGDDGEEIPLTNNFIDIARWLEALGSDIAATAAA